MIQLLLLYKSKKKSIRYKQSNSYINHIPVKNRPVKICLDFDGTCVTNEFPNVGKDIGAAPVLKALVKNGHKLILNTMRSDGEQNLVLKNNYSSKRMLLSDAIKWFNSNEIELYSINNNPKQTQWTDSPKIYCDYIIDDSALGIPLKMDLKLSEKPFVDWEEVENILVSLQLIEES